MTQITSQNQNSNIPILETIEGKHHIISEELHEQIITLQLDINQEQNILNKIYDEATPEMTIKTETLQKILQNI